MGVLDDAIREHLELKRKHGVPEDEVQRQEDEALGPARREVAQQPEDAETAAAAADEAALFDGEQPAPEGAEPAEPELSAAAEPEPPAAQPESTPVEPPPVEPPPVEEPPVAEPPVEEPPVEEPPVEGHASEPAALSDEPLAPGQPLGEHDDVDDIFAADEPEDESLLLDSDPEQEELDDVLEDTPDFLQETPEHDRLWFEQRPPRDFDFD